MSCIIFQKTKLNYCLRSMVDFIWEATDTNQFAFNSLR